ncbi:hypothetical protein ENBRE01_1048 [Enteropsectra breve]|nr:hypothetical protein ENBRE01_1048 [Enteropsectra breve]
MLRINFPNEEILLRENEIPSEKDFSVLLTKMEDRSVTHSQMLAAAHVYRKNYEYAKELLKLALNKVEAFYFELQDNKQNRGERIKRVAETKILMLGNEIQFGNDPKYLFDQLQGHQDRKIDYLKGVYFYKNANYEDAYFSFSKAQHMHGMEMCALKLKSIPNAGRSTDCRIRCFEDAREWKKINKQDIQDAPLDFKYRIGASDNYQNENNIDVILTKFRRGINENRNNVNELEKLLNEHKKLDEINSAEIAYLIGKIHHLCSRYREAKEYYNKSLLNDPNYLPALINQSILEKKLISVAANSESVSDYNAILRLSGAEDVIDLNSSSIEVRNLVSVALSAKKLEKEAVVPLLAIISKEVDSDFETLIPENIKDDVKRLKGKIGNNLAFDTEAAINNAAVILNSKESAGLLKYALSKACSKYRQCISYNLGIFTNNTEMLLESGFEEASEYIKLINKDPSSPSSELNGYICMLLARDNKNSPDVENAYTEQAKEIFTGVLSKNNKSLSAALAMGNILLGEYFRTLNDGHIKDALEHFKSVAYSCYGINGMGICYSLLGCFSGAVKLFRQIMHDLNDAAVNMANTFVLQQDYENAFKSFLKVKCGKKEFANRFSGIMLSAGKMISNKKLIKEAVDRGIDGLHINREAETRLCEDDNEVRKRKIQELVEYRKRKNL